MYRRPLFVLMAVAGLVLLIACANVASLLLARASSRQREIAVRLAIGAGRGRIIRQLLIESTLLSLMGAALGIQLAWFCSYAFVSIIASAQDSGIAFDLSPNWRILAFACGVAVATGVLFGAAPALQTSSAEPVSALKQNEIAPRTRSRLLPSLVSVQVALSLVLVAGAGLFLRTLQNLQNLDPGFSSEGVLLVDLDEYPGPLPPGLLDDVRRLPGVVSASASTHTPLSMSRWSDVAIPAGQPLPERDNALFIGAGPGYFPTLQIQILSGREFTELDTATSPAVAIVNEVFAQKHFPNRNPVGERLQAIVAGDRRVVEIVGIARNTNVAGLRQSSPATVYVPYAQSNRNSPGSLAVLASGALGQALTSLQQTVQARLPNMSIAVRPLSAQVGATLVRERLMATLAGGFGALALLLSCIGLYGLLAYTVTQRTKEIGIRMALGARSERVVGLVIGRAAKLVVVGLALGLLATWAATRWIESMLFGLTPTDPFVLTGSMLLLAAAAQLAAYLPARRASRVDPLVALRAE
jgi:predicted permease